MTKNVGGKGFQKFFYKGYPRHFDGEKEDL